MHELGIALLLALRIGLPGWLWMAPADDESSRKASRVISFAGRAIPLGLVLNLLPSLCAAQLALWTPTVDWCLWAGVAVAGAVWRGRLGFKTRLADGLVLIGFLMVVSWLLLLLPPRSEWIAGGWDPGLYQNFSVVVSRSGGFSDIASVYSQLEVGERALFGKEVFAGVPIDHSSGSLQHYFFQLMPMCGAIFHRIGGFDLMFRINQVLALIALPAVFAFLGAIGVKGWRSVWCMVLWCISPLWWYHHALPTTEILQLLLLVGAATFYIDAERKGSGFPVICALLLAAIGVNHFGFPALVSILLVVAAVAESYAGRPGRKGRLLTCAVGLAVGLSWDLVFSTVTLVHLQAKDAAITLVLSVFSASIVVAYLACVIVKDSTLTRRVGRFARAASVVLGAAVLVLACLNLFMSPESSSFIGGLLVRLRQVAVFHDALWPFLLGLGILGVALNSSASHARISAACAGFGGVTLLLLISPGIAPIYPWALRRYIVLLLPCVLLLIGCGLSSWFSLLVARMPRAGKALVGLIVAGIVILAMPESQRAASVGDYVGYRDIVEAIDSQLEDADIVVADDSRIGTPLLLAYGRNVLNGEVFWKSREETVGPQFMAMLARLQTASGGRVLWLTSTEQGTALYPSIIGATSPSGAVIEGTYSTVVHSTNADSFRTRANQRPFQLHLWQAHE